jgi:citrate synthase
VLDWETSISRVVSDGAEEEVIVSGHRLSELIGQISFAEMMFLLLRGDLPTPAKEDAQAAAQLKGMMNELQLEREPAESTPQNNAQLKAEEEAIAAVLRDPRTTSAAPAR